MGKFMGVHSFEVGGGLFFYYANLPSTIETVLSSQPTYVSSRFLSETSLDFRPNPHERVRKAEEQLRRGYSATIFERMGPALYAMGF